MTRRPPARALLLPLLLAGVGAQCSPGPVSLDAAPPEPQVLDDRGQVDRDVFDELIATTEKVRGLGFIRRPTLELLADDDARLPELRETASSLEPLREQDPKQGDAAVAPDPNACFADPDRDRVLCLPPPDLTAMRRSLARLIDAQNYPHLVRTVAQIPGDPGVAVRSLLAGSAGAAATTGLGPPTNGDTPDFLAPSTVEQPPIHAPNVALTIAAAFFLAAQSDREAPFRAPPLSTRQVLSPLAYRASDRPLLLLGAPPALLGCRVTSDESVGVARLLATWWRDPSGPAPALSGWQGDRALRFVCDDETEPWIYVAELKDEVAAGAFAAEIERLLPPEFARSIDLTRRGKRVALGHGLPPDAAPSWARTLEARSLRNLDELP